MIITSLIGFIIGIRIIIKTFKAKNPDDSILGIYIICLGFVSGIGIAAWVKVIEAFISKISAMG